MTEKISRGTPITFRQGIFFFTLPVLTWLAACLGIAYIASTHLSLWLALPLGFVAGTAVMAFWIYSQGGASSVIELNAGAAILLILMLIVVPVFIRVNQVRQRRFHHHHAKPSSPLKTSAHLRLELNRKA